MDDVRADMPPEWHIDDDPILDEINAFEDRIVDLYNDRNWWGPVSAAALQQIDEEIADVRAALLRFELRMLDRLWGNTRLTRTPER